MEPHFGKGYCDRHYHAFRNYGDPYMTKIRLPIPDYLKLELRRKAKKKYKNSEKGSLSENIYRKSASYKLIMNRVRQNPKVKLRKRFWAKYSEKGRALQEKWRKIRRSRIKQATPKWVNRQMINFIYGNCPKDMHVDHIIPIHHKDVCGLHVPWNLRYVNKQENLRKGNKFENISTNTY